jgi:hypothetical protein
VWEEREGESVKRQEREREEKKGWRPTFSVQDTACQRPHSLFSCIAKLGFESLRSHLQFACGWRSGEMGS